jgi:hypothetical protein
LLRGSSVASVVSKTLALGLFGMVTACINLESLGASPVRNMMDDGFLISVVERPVILALYNPLLVEHVWEGHACLAFASCIFVCGVTACSPEMLQMTPSHVCSKHDRWSPRGSLVSPSYPTFREKGSCLRMKIFKDAIVGDTWMSKTSVGEVRIQNVKYYYIYKLDRIKS